jgi:perosamine synthetase
MIPVFEPVIGEEEIQFVTDALRKGELSGTFGHYLESFEQEFAAYSGCKYGIAVSNGSTALHLAVDAAGIQPGDEVLISASTNIATALAVVHNGAIPVPVDSEEETWNLDPNLLESLITPKTKAIIPVHLFGHPVDMDALMVIANKHNLVVIEDCAESHGASCNGRMTGSFGAMGCYSFYANKVITTGEGGMVVTNDEALAVRLRLLRNLAFTEPRFKHEVAGYNFRMTGYQAAMGLAQTRKINKIVDEKRRVAHAYNRHLANVVGIQLPVERNWAKNVYWMYAIVVNQDFGVSRDVLAMHLKAEGIDTRTFFCSMSDQPCLQKISGFRNIPTPVASRIWESGMYLPSTHTLKEAEIQYIAEAIKKIQRSA